MSSELKKEALKEESSVYNTSYQESSNHFHVNNSRVNVTDLVNRLKDCKEQMDPEAIQTIVYSVGKDNGYKENLREWFKAIYEIIFGDQDGPRMGFFISFFGIKESVELINKYIK